MHNMSTAEALLWLMMTLCVIAAVTFFGIFGTTLIGAWLIAMIIVLGWGAIVAVMAAAENARGRRANELWHDE